MRLCNFFIFYLDNYFLSCYNKLGGLWPFHWLTLGHVVKVVEVAPSGDRGGDGEGIKARVALSGNLSLRPSFYFGNRVRGRIRAEVQDLTVWQFLRLLSRPSRPRPVVGRVWAPWSARFDD